jgi:hypothetical protein
MDGRLLLRPAADATNNDFMRDVVGSKDDAAAVGVVSETESIIAYLKQLVATQPEIVAGTTDTTPLGSMDLWSCSGPVLIHDIWGIVTTTAVAAATTNCKLSFDPDDGGSDVDLCANLDLTGKAVGTILRVTRDVSEALIASLDVAEVTDYHAPAMILGQAGDIKVTYGAASAGQINWYLMYTKIGTGVITAA